MCHRQSFSVSTLLLAFAAIGFVIHQVRADEADRLERGPIVNLAADGVAYLFVQPGFDIDGSHSKEELVDAFERMVDRYAEAEVPYLFLNVCYQRAAYDSQVWDTYWDVDDPEKQVTGWPRKMWLAHCAGVDPFAVCVARCREKGVSPWMSIRMNDLHYLDDPSRSSRLWQEHPELRRGDGRIGYDFAKQEVQDHYLALIKELAERYDCDGIELDWMRFPYHFRDGQEQEGRRHLNEFMARAKDITEAAAKRRGHGVKIAVRIPAALEAALHLGMDGVTWVREGLADMVILSSVWRPTDTDIAIEGWRDAIGPVDHEYLLVAATDLWIQSAGGGALMKDDLETQRGFTAAMLHRGADLVYLFNHFNSNDFRLEIESADGTTSIRDENHGVLFTAGRMSEAVAGARRHVLSFHDPAPPGDKRPLPAEIAAGQSAAFRIYTGPRPEAGRVAVRIGLDKRDGVESAELVVSLNGTECEPMGDLSAPSSIPFADLPGGGVPHVAYVADRVSQFEVPLGSVVDGSNQIEVTLKGGPAQKIVWAEIYVVPR